MGVTPHIKKIDHSHLEILQREGVKESRKCLFNDVNQAILTSLENGRNRPNTFDPFQQWAATMAHTLEGVKK